MRGEVGPGSDGSWNGLRSVSSFFFQFRNGGAGIIRSWTVSRGLIS